MTELLGNQVMIIAEVANYWVHNLDPFLLRFNGDFGIRWYGVSYLAGFLAAYGLYWFYFKKGRSPLAPENQSNLITYIILGVLVGGRLGYMFFYEAGRASLFENPASIFRVWDGGMASHGGFLGVAVAVILFSRRYKMDKFVIGDLIVTAAPAGLCFGRLANFMNGELWGRVAQVPWAIIFPGANDGLPRHPSQLYEATLEGLLIFVYVQIRFWRTKVAREVPGQLAGEMLIAYSAARIICENFREPDAGEDLVWGLSKGQLYSFGLVAGGIALIVLARGRVARSLSQVPR